MGGGACAGYSRQLRDTGDTATLSSKLAVLYRMQSSSHHPRGHMYMAGPARWSMHASAALSGTAGTGHQYGGPTAVKHGMYVPACFLT